MWVTPDVKKASAKKFAQMAFTQGNTVRSDGYQSYIPALEGFVHEHESYNPGSGVLHWPHIAISNAVSFILGPYHGLPKDNLQSYLDEFCFRLCRRSFGTALFDRLAPAIGISVRPN